LHVHYGVLFSSIGLGSGLDLVSGW